MEPSATAPQPVPATAPAQTPVAPQPPAAPVLSITAIRAQQNFGLAVAAGLGAALVGAIAWAIVTVITQLELGLMAIAVGYIVGQTIKETGKGIDQQFGILGAVCSLLGSVLGNALSVVAFYGQANHISYMEALGKMDFNLISQLMTVTFDPLDLLFYGIAVYQGYKLSFKYRAL